MRYSDQGFIAVDQLLAPIALGTQADLQQVARYKEASLVQQGPARDAFVATVGQQLADRLQDCRQFVRGEKAELGIKSPTPPLTNLPADKRYNMAEAGKETVRGSTLAPVTPDSRVDGVRRSRRIAAAKSMTVVAADTAISNMEQGPARELMLLAKACANKEEAADDDRHLDNEEGEDSESKSQSHEEVSKLSRLQATVGRLIEGQFYEYPQKVVALLELGYLKELKQGVFLRIPDSSQRESHPDLSGLARRLRAGQREQDTFEALLDNCHLFALGNGIFCDKTFHQTTQTRAASNKTGEELRTPPIAIDSGSTITREAYLAIVETGLESKYGYSPMLEALVQLGFLGVFLCVRDPKLQKKAFSLGALATQALHRGLENTFLNILKQQRELFECSTIDTNERYWDKVREKFAQAKFYGASWREAAKAALSGESTTSTVTVSRASATQVVLCDVSEEGLGALLGSLPASYSCDRYLGTHKAPRVDNSDPYNVALTVNGRILQHIIVDTGCEMVVVGKTAARQAGIRPSMMRSGAVALRCADERVTKAFDRTIDSIPFAFNPGTENETTVMAQVVVTNSEADTVLLGMSVIGKIGLVPNPYKGKLKYYVDWETRGSRSAHLACVFDVEFGSKRRKSQRSTACEEVYSKAALVLPMVAAPRNDFECWANRLHYQDYQKQLADELALSFSSLALPSLKEEEAKPPIILLEGYRDLKPLNQDIVDISKPIVSQGLVVVELCGGILSATEALIRTGVKIRQLYVCEIDSEARALAAARLEVLSKMFPELLPVEAFKRCFSVLPHDIAMIKYRHVRELGPVDSIICGFPCQGFSRASRKAQGLRDPRSAVFLDMVHIMHVITSQHGDCG
jgi:predicted aspartyl protease